VENKSKFWTSLVQFPFLFLPSPHCRLPGVIDPVSVLGAGATAYSLAAGAALLLQVRTMRRRGSSRDVSVGFLATTSGGYLIWLLYGLGINSCPLIASDAIGLVCSLFTVGVAVRLRNPLMAGA
jgi:uncharacterized protein with PQ loop repeat